jgi:glycosyltransferase involved in cell wall biosynthesis
LKITFVLPYASTAGGVRVAAIYANHLTEMGHEVSVVSSERGKRSMFRILAGVIKKKRKLRRKKGKPPTDQLGFLGDRHIVVPRNRPILASDIPDGDVIIATWWETAFLVAALPAEKGRKFYFIQHHEVHDHLPNYVSAGSYYLPLTKITISQWLVDIMADRYGDADVDMIENSVDLKQFNAPERGRAKRPTVGLLYATGAFKGVDISIKAIRRAKERVPNLQVIAFGAKAMDARLKLPSDTIYHEAPAQKEIRDIYALCDVWLCGSRAEGFHLPPSEAMACRCPVVSTRVGGAVEIVTEGVNGHVVDVEDHVALGDRLADVLALPEGEWKKMSDAAYARATSYSWRDAAIKFERALLDR